MNLPPIAWVYQRQVTGVMSVSLIVISAPLTVFPFTLSLLVDMAVMEDITMTNMRKITTESMKAKTITRSTAKTTTMSMAKSAFSLKLNLKR